MNQLLRIHAIWNPHVYHGWGRSKRFFEGWYYKIVNDSQTSAFAIIPGIAMDENGNKQSFIQVLDGMNNIAKYQRLSIDSHYHGQLQCTHLPIVTYNKLHHYIIILA